MVTTSILTSEILCVCVCTSVYFSSFAQHAEMADESVQLKTLQTILIIFQSHLHPENEVSNSWFCVQFQFSWCNVKVDIIVLMQSGFQNPHMAT